jgi:SAM-dependent methyltransferase
MPRMPSDATPPDPGLLDFVGSALPAAPARVLEVGAGDGALAAALRERGYDVVAIDPAASTPDVLPVALLAFDGAPAGFDAAVAVVSLHHVEPLEESCRRLGELVRPGGRLVVDELDVAALDERAARWWLDRRAEAGAEVHDHGAAGLVAAMRDHIHPVALVLEALAREFALDEPVRGPYLHRWSLPPGLREVEEALIADGRLPATGLRVTGTRRGA